MIAEHTAILITHRMSAVGLANKVAVFDKGHVAEYGTHAELTQRAASIPRCSTSRRSSTATIRMTQQALKRLCERLLPIRRHNLCLQNRDCL